MDGGQHRAVRVGPGAKTGCKMLRGAELLFPTEVLTMATMRRITICLSLLIVCAVSAGRLIAETTQQNFTGSNGPDTPQRPAALELSAYASQERGWAKRMKPFVEPAPETPGVVDAALNGAMADVEEIVFAVRQRGGGHFYETAGYEYFQPDNLCYSQAGGMLCKMNVRTGEVTILLKDLGGVIRDPCPSYDATKILFSWRPAGDRNYHLYEIDANGENLRQLTNTDFDDVEPIYLPNGDIVFSSTRSGRGVPCWRTCSGSLFRCDPDGTNVRMLSNGIEWEMSPWVLPDGRIVYCRWEYINRSATMFHHLWTMNPDGTSSMTYYGNHYPGFAMTEAKPIPGTNKIACIFGSAHGNNERKGLFVILSPEEGPDEKDASRILVPAAPVKTKRRPFEAWRDPWPFSEDCFLACVDDTIYVVNGQGQYESLYTVPDWWSEETKALENAPSYGPFARPFVHEVKPLTPRERETIIPDRTEYTQSSGELILQDVGMSRSFGPDAKSRISQLLLIEALPLPLSYSNNKDTTGADFDLRRILGTVPVEEDGSAYIKAPSMRNLIFVALDSAGNEIHRMKSFVNVMPGEVTSCVGCHEHRTQAPHEMPEQTLTALQRPPSEIRPLEVMPPNGLYDYGRDIQPILDKYCADCHNSRKFAGGLALDSRSIGVGHHIGRTLLARRTQRIDKLLISHMDGSHNKVQATEEEIALIRNWAYVQHQDSGTYGSFGMRSQATGFPWMNPRNDGYNNRRGPNLSFDVTLIEQKCDRCHFPNDRAQAPGKFAGRLWPMADNSGHVWNVHDPDRALLVLAPLAKEAGGLGLCQDRLANRKALRRLSGDERKEELNSDAPAKIFTDKNDPDYQQLLAISRSVSKQMLERRLYPVPNWRPTYHFLREMKHYGALPEDFDLETGEIDPFALDDAYFHLFYPGGRRFHEGLWKAKQDQDEQTQSESCCSP
jgi:hypothetical protein